MVEKDTPLGAPRAAAPGSSGAVPSGAVPRLCVSDLSKTFPGVVALDGVNLRVAAGEVHAVVGENGAGKSTLMRIIAGADTPDSGTVALDGEVVTGLDEHAAARLGIGMVHQERSLVAHLSVAENIFAGRQPSRLGRITWRSMRAAAAALLLELGSTIDPASTVGSLSPAQRQLVEIAKALSLQLRVLILDEPTAALTVTESRNLFEVVRGLAARGVAVLYISHRLAEVFQLATHVTVLKDGRVTGGGQVADMDEHRLMTLMVGRELTFARTSSAAACDAPLALEVRNLSSRPRVLDASLAVRAGEIVCLAGLVGAGRSELCETVFGARSLHGGSVVVGGRERRIREPADAMAAGIGFLPEDRKDAGLFLDMSLVDNVSVANLAAVSPNGTVSRRAARDLAGRYVQRLRVATPSLDQRVGNLSGGNQQKILLARWLAREPAVLIIDEPTRGVDVGARADIYAVLRELAAAGMAILVVSSDLMEVLTLADRIVVMAEGRTVGELDGDTATEMAVLKMASPVAASHGMGSTADTNLSARSKPA